MMRKKKFGGVTVAGVKQKEQKNWGGQVVLVLALGGVLLGGTFAFAAGESTAGITALSVCIASLIVFLVTAFRAVSTWDF
jgi:hypothetical protein